MKSTTKKTPTYHANSETRPHAEFSPSALKNYEACASYIGRSGTNPVAEAGTRIHTAIEKNNPGMLLDPEEQNLAHVCLDFLADLRGDRGGVATLLESHQEIALEIHVGDNSTYGTCDLVDVWSDGRATVIDWKTGWGAVEDAEVNLQAISYSIGVFSMFPNVERIDFYFVLPRRHEVSVAQFTRGNLARIGLRVGTVIARAKEARAAVFQDPQYFNPTEGVCDYCARQGSCRALAGKALLVAKKAGYEVPEDVSTQGSAEDKNKILKLANMLAEWAESTKKEILRQSLEEGLELPDFRIQERKTSRTVESPLLGFAAVSDMMSFEEFLSACTRVSVPTLEKIVAEKADRGQKGNVRQQLEDRLRDKGALKEEGIIHFLKPIRK